MSAISSNLQGLKNALALDRNQDLFSRSLTSLSSGTKSNLAAENPVAASVAGELTSQQQRLSAASTNIQNAVSYTQTGNSILTSVSSLLQRMSQIVTLAQDPTQSSADVANYQTEFQGLQNDLRKTIGGTTAEIGGVSGVASPLGSFDGIALFGANPSGYQVVLGAAGESMTIPPTNLQSGATLSLIQQDSSGNYTLNISSASSATLTAALQQVAVGQASLGSAQARLNAASTAVLTQNSDMAAAVSQITDVDVAATSTQLAKYNVLVQADAAIAAQANSNAQSVLKLLKQ